MRVQCSLIFIAIFLINTVGCPPSVNDDDDSGDIYQPCEGETNGPTWHVLYNGISHLEIDVEDAGYWDVDCNTNMSMFGNGKGFWGNIECNTPDLSTGPFSIQGEKVIDDDCVDGTIDAILVGHGTVTWLWNGTMDRDSLLVTFADGGDGVEATGIVDLSAVEYAVVSVSPDHGDLDGGFDLMLFGTGFTTVDDTIITIGGVEAEVITVVVDEWGGGECRIVAPQFPTADTVDIVMINSNGTYTLSDAFEYMNR